jgi:hypothetical protein
MRRAGLISLNQSGIGMMFTDSDSKGTFFSRSTKYHHSPKTRASARGE